MNIAAWEDHLAKPRRRQGNREAEIQAGIVDYIRTVAPDVLIFAVPNGGLRSKSEAARMKWTGTVAGIPDLCIIGPRGKAYFIEVKAPRGSRSVEQITISMKLTALGCKSIVAYSIDNVREAFDLWGIETRETVPMTGVSSDRNATRGGGG